MRLQDIMSRDIKTVSSSTTVAQARIAMRLNGVHHLIVRDGKTIVGIVSQRDFGTRPSGTEARAVADVMTANVVTAAPETTIRQAANLFRGRSIGCLPVVEGTEPVGIVTTTDLLDLIGRGAERPAASSTRWTLSKRGPRRTGPSSRRARRG
jgi:acetoin utilization protein AcuB